MTISTSLLPVIKTLQIVEIVKSPSTEEKSQLSKLSLLSACFILSCYLSVF